MSKLTSVGINRISESIESQNERKKHVFPNTPKKEKPNKTEIKSQKGNFFSTNIFIKFYVCGNSFFSSFFSVLSCYPMEPNKNLNHTLTNNKKIQRKKNKKNHNQKKSFL